MKTEYTSIWVNGVSVITQEEANTNTTDNIYYLHWLSDDYEFQEWKRAKDDDIIEKDYFVLDIDLRNNVSYEITNEDIKKEWQTLAQHLLEEDEYFWEWSKIVFTWNWLHIYYHWIPRYIDKKTYSMWVERIYRQWDKFIWDKAFKCDHACKNISRILRLPWSINQKNWAKVEILAEEDRKSRLFDFIESFAKKELEEQEEKKRIRKQEMEEHLKELWTDGALYEDINKIPAYIIAQWLVPDFPYDWKKNFKNKKWWYTGYYYVEETNTIANWWSRYFDYWDSSSCWNNFSLVKKYNNWTNYETFTYFKKLLWKQ